MPVEFIGMISTQSNSEYLGGTHFGGAVDPTYVRDFARAHEAAGFDRVLIGYSSNSADGFAVASFIGANTDRLGILLAHRPGFVEPTLAARKLATVDQFIGGRMAVHIISIADDAEAQRDGDWSDKATRYARADEYIDVLRQTWQSEAPFDHEGRFYHTRGSFSSVKPVAGTIPIYFGGSSAPAIEVGARQADVWAMWGEPIAAATEQIAAIRAKAAAFGRQLRISISFRPILGATESEAWDQAYTILEGVRARRAGMPPRVVNNAGSQRLLDFAAEGEILDTRLFTAIAKVTGAAGNSTALVGTPDQVAEAMLAYYDAGADAFLIRGFDPLDDVVAYGRDLLPAVRAEVARRDRESAPRH